MWKATDRWRARNVAPEAHFLVFASLLCTASISVLATSGYWSRPAVVAPAVMVDLTLGLPLLGYLFLVRMGRTGPGVLLPLFLVGALLARWWIPEPHRLASEPIKMVVVVLEAVVFFTLASRIRTIRRVYRQESVRRPYRSEAMEEALAEVFGGRLGPALFTEGAALWFGLAGWGRSRGRHPEGEVFTDLRRSGYPAVLGALLLVVVVETAGLHLLVGLWSKPVAWVLTGLAIYSAIWLLGDFNAARRQPTLVSDFGLHLRSGLRWRVDVPWSAVRGLRLHPPEVKALRLTRIGRPGLWVEFEGPQTARGLLGMRRPVTVVGLGLDDPARFQRLIEDRRPSRGREEQGG